MSNPIQHVHIARTVGVGAGKLRIRDERDVAPVGADGGGRTVEYRSVHIVLIDGEHCAHRQPEGQGFHDTAELPQ